jgi:sugar lactone lactonase YvrE
MSSLPSFYLTDLPAELQFVNHAPIHLSATRGRASLIYFWSSSSIYCQQLLADIKSLEGKFLDGLNVIGVHTPKFSAERENEHVLKVVNRWHIKHPVINDSEWRLWRMLNVQAWPTMILLDAEGKISGAYFGEGHKAEIESRIHQLLSEAQAKGMRRSDAPLSAKKPEAKSFLSFPSYIAAGVDRLYVSDTGNNRVLELSYEGRVTRIFGSGNAGFWDGRAHEAGLREPQGLCVGKDELFICDTGNHAIRRVRLSANDQIDTIAGTGRMGLALQEPGASRSLSFASPVSCCFSQDRLFVTLAGNHQVWMIDLIRNQAARVAGNGVDALADGGAMSASFSKPCGIALARDGLYVADTNNSALRHISFPEFQVRTVIGDGAFEFGDTDGAASLARLQHPGNILFDAQRNVIWIADSYNNKIKVYSISKNEVKTLNVSYKLQEPQGMTIADNALWVVNQNAHELLRLDLKTGKLGRINVSLSE